MSTHSLSQARDRLARAVQDLERALPETGLRWLRALAWAASGLLLLLCGLVILLGTRYAGLYAQLWLAGCVLGLAATNARLRWRGPAVLGCQLLLFLGGSLALRRGPSFDELEGEGDAIVAALERHRAASGSFPTSLAHAGCEPGWNRFGGWEYEPLLDGHSWRLSVGDYGKDGFILYRDAEDTDWSWDQ